MNHLARELAPISDAAWAEIDEEATRSLTHFLAARKLVDFEGPLGYDAAAISLGRLDVLADQPAQDVTAARRRLLPLVELRRSFTLDRAELESIDRGACDADLDAVVDACQAMALAEDTMVFEGYVAADIEGIVAASPHDPVALDEDFARYPTRVATAVATLKAAGVAGPYGLALGPRCYAGVIETTEKGGYPLLQHLALILGGPVVWAPAADGAVLISQRGGDFQLTVGQDTSIAYRSHDATTVTLELQESAAFLACSPRPPSPCATTPDHGRPPMGQAGVMATEPDLPTVQPGRERHVGLTGLAVMGRNLARNIAHHGFAISVHNRTSSKVDDFLADHGDEGDIEGHHDLADFVASLARPRVVVVMVKAGAPVDAVIGELAEHLDEGDVVIDGGNSDYTDSNRRTDELAEAGLGFLGTGVSGGEEGALHGPSIMPGGSRAAYQVVEPLLMAIAAVVDDTPCCTYIGDGGAGHYVKMVHNGIEYADMALIAETYDLLGSGLGLDNDEMADVFATWNGGDLESFLIEITATVLRREDDERPGRLIDRVVDAAAQKGTGRLTAMAALEVGTALTTITEAVFARTLSSQRQERLAAASVLPAPTPVDFEATAEDLRDALYGAKVVAYAQGFEQLAKASSTYDWDLHPAELATIWRGGCIIRARFLDRIREAFEGEDPPVNLVLDPYFIDALARVLPAWRRVVADAVRAGIPVPALSSALAWFDGYRRPRLPANLIQAQRDLFGAHTYERTDQEGTFHTDWSAPTQ